MSLKFQKISDNVTNAYGPDGHIRGVVAYRPEEDQYEIGVIEKRYSRKTKKDENVLENWTVMKNIDTAKKYLQDNVKS